MVQALIDAGSLQGTRGAYRLLTPVEKLLVPSTVQAVLAARIDRLGEREKAVLQTAAVIGKEFSEPILRAVLLAPVDDQLRDSPSRRPRKDGASSGRAEMFFENNHSTVRPEEPPSLWRRLEGRAPRKSTVSGRRGSRKSSLSPQGEG